MKTHIDRKTDLPSFPSRDTKNGFNKKTHPYTRGRAFWLEHLAFWRINPEKYSEASKEYYENSLQP